MNALSLSELGHGCDDCVDGVGGVAEGWVVAGTPRELGAQAGENTILNVVLWGEVTELLVDGSEGVLAGHEVDHFEHGHLLDVADIPHGLELLEVTGVVREVEHEVVGVGNLKLLDALALVTDLADSGFDVVLSLHESVVLGLDLADDCRGVDVAFPLGPVDGVEVALVGGGLIEELEHGLDLSELIAALVVVCGHSESVDPLGGEVRVLCGVADHCAVGRGGSGSHGGGGAVDNTLSEFSSKVRHIIYQLLNYIAQI